jgi:hypothetical protein
MDRRKNGGATTRAPPNVAPQPTIEQKMRGGPVKEVVVSADILRAQRRVDAGTGGSVETPWGMMQTRAKKKTIGRRTWSMG